MNDASPARPNWKRPRLEPTDPLGWALRQKRQEIGMSARMLSLAAGLSESYVGKAEAGRLELSFRNFAKIAVALGLNAHEIAWLVRQAAVPVADNCHTPEAC